MRLRGATCVAVAAAVHMPCAWTTIDATYNNTAYYIMHDRPWKFLLYNLHQLFDLHDCSVLLTIRPQLSEF